MSNKKRLVKNAISLIVTIGITTISSSATDARPLKENTEKGANAVSNCIRNHKEKPTPPKVNRIPSTGNKQADDTDNCYVCRRTKRGCSYLILPCSYASSNCCE
jgi:hypothetical protein